MKPNQFIFLVLITLSINHSIAQSKGRSIVEIEIKQIGNIKNTSKNILIYFLIRNSQDLPIYINNPACWGSSTPLIKFNHVKAYPIIKVKINPACAEELVKINGHDSIILNYKYSLDKLMNVNEIGNYRLQFEYSGSIFSVNKEKIRNIDLFTNEISFEVSK